MIVKGVKISELELRDKLTGEEMIPFQDQLSNGKMDMKSIIGYFEEVSDQEVNLQSLVNIKQYVSNSKELEFVSSNVGDVYFNTGDKKLYVYQEGGTWATTDPSKYRMYVRLDKDEYGRTNIIHRWDGNNMTVISERLFIGEEEGTAYEGSKGKQVRDDLDALNATIDKYPAKLVSDILDPNYSDSSVDLRYSFYDRISDTNSTGTKTVDCASQSNAGFMAAADKVKLDVTLPNDIKAEEDARKAADSTLQGNIDSSNSDLNSKITAETERATQAENTITTNYKAADTTLQSNINNEATTRSEADAALDSKISKEVSDRTQAVSTLQGSLDTEIARATKAEQDITSAYEAADTTLQNNINAINNSKGVANGIATLDQNGLVPSSQLPSYVDDVIEVNTFSALPNTGESGKIYITQDTNLTYRWSGTAYVEISQSLALGETSSTAYAGDKGKATTDKLNRIPNKLIVDANGVTYNDPDSVVLKYTFYKQQEQETSTNIHTINAATTATPGIMTAADKTKLNGLKDQAGITADIDAVQTNLETHINNKTNPHEVTKAQVGLGNVDNTADTDKPISTATQTALDAKFSLTEGNSLKTTADSLPDRIIAYIPGSSIDATGETVSITEGTQYVNKSNGVYGSLKQSSVTKTLTAATTTKAGVLTAADKVKIDKITTDGDGTRYLADNGTYKLIQGGGSGDSGTFVLETAAADQLTDTEYNDLKDAIEANKIIIADLGLTLGAIAQIYQPCFAATYDSGSNRIVLSLTQTTGTVSSSEDTRRLVVCDIIISGNTGHSVSRDNYNLVNENMVLTFGNTKEYTPTTVYSPATKKYVDDNRYGKTFVVSSVNSLLTNRKETGSAAETATNNIFGSKESFRAVVDDIISNHTRYYIHVDGDANNCIELGCVNAWKNADSSTYQLHFIMIYYTGSTLYTKRIGINSDNSADNAYIEIVDLVNSDNINVMTKKTTSEYNSLSKNDNTAYFVVD